MTSVRANITDCSRLGAGTKTFKEGLPITECVLSGQSFSLTASILFYILKNDVIEIVYYVTTSRVTIQKGNALNIPKQKKNNSRKQALLHRECFPSERFHFASISFPKILLVYTLPYWRPCSQGACLLSELIFLMKDNHVQFMSCCTGRCVTYLSRGRVVSCRKLTFCHLYNLCQLLPLWSSA